MIVTRTPLRMPLGGGGTDLPSYYRRYGGFLVSSAINKYIYIIVHRRFEDDILIKYSRTEHVEVIDQIQHPIVRQALDLLSLGPGLEIVSIADIPANTGLGSSSSFTVGLLHALHAYKRESVSPWQLAQEAFHIEVALLGEPIGWQDQCVAAYGGIVCIEISCAGAVKVTPLCVREEVIEQLENDVTLFYTGIQRSASDILSEQGQAVKRGNEEVTAAMHEIKTIGFQVMEALMAGDLPRFGGLLHQHWLAKRKISPKISSEHLDRCYELARQNGAIGGKVMGAGGGGFYMFYCNSNDKNVLRRALEAEGLRDVRFAIDREGSKVIVNF